MNTIDSQGKPIDWQLLLAIMGSGAAALCALAKAKDKKAVAVVPTSLGAIREIAGALEAMLLEKDVPRAVVIPALVQICAIAKDAMPEAEKLKEEHEENVRLTPRRIRAARKLRDARELLGECYVRGAEGKRLPKDLVNRLRAALTNVDDFLKEVE